MKPYIIRLHSRRMARSCKHHVYFNINILTMSQLDVDCRLRSNRLDYATSAYCLKIGADMASLVISPYR